MLTAFMIMGAPSKVQAPYEMQDDVFLHWINQPYWAYIKPHQPVCRSKYLLLALRKRQSYDATAELSQMEGMCFRSWQTQRVELEKYTGDYVWLVKILLPENKFTMAYVSSFSLAGMD